jgi:hypothetical protein
MLAEWVRSPRFGGGDRRRPRDPDANVDGDAAVGTGKNRVEVELGDLRKINREPR